jgi:hypothetical protein
MCPKVSEGERQMASKLSRHLPNALPGILHSVKENFKKPDPLQHWSMCGCVGIHSSFFIF